MNRICFLFIAIIATAASAADIAVLPADITLTGPEARQRLLVQRVDGGNIGAELRNGLQYTSSNEAVVRVIDGVLTPTGNGQAKITVAAEGKTVTANVAVEKFEQPHVWNYRNQVQSVLSKTGCNTGACHGASAGKNGFKLSLRGYDPEGDFLTLTRQARGRRIVPHDPGRSLLLTKPTGAIPHKGGLRFREDSLEYRVIAEWIAQGQPGPTADDPKVSRLEILPAGVRLSAGDKQSLVVRAHFSDGHVEDVTRWAKYTTTNLTACNVDDQGLVSVTGSGEAAVVAWYLAHNVAATVTVPYAQAVSPEAYTLAPQANIIDKLVVEKLRGLNMPPSAICNDGDFLRRAHLDTIGVLPTADEAMRFLADPDPLKRQKLVDDLLTRAEFVDYWTYYWSDVLLLTGNRLRPEALKSFSNWIRDKVAANAPWDQFVREMVTAKGSTIENGAANFYALHQDPLDMAETTSMAFLGMSINCARCHDHPLEKWTNDDYYGMASLFARVRGKGWGGDFRNGDGNRTIFLADRGEVMQPRIARAQLPRPLDGTALTFEDPADRREHLAKWLTAPENPYFSRAVANRIWANYLGVGLVEKVDDLRLTNPASNEHLLTALADHLVQNQYDLKSLMRLILNSQTYQRSSHVLPENSADQRFYARCYPRRLKAEVLLDAVSDVTGVMNAFKDHPAGTRTLQLKDASVASYFLDTFGRPERILTCTCERSDEPSMTQILHLANGKTLLEKLEAKEGRIAKWVDEKTLPEQLVDQLFLTALSRLPSENEKSRLIAALTEVPENERRPVMEDLMWSVLTSREFLFQH